MSSKSRKFVESSRSVNIIIDKIDAVTQKLDSDTLDGHSANYFATVSSPTLTGTPHAPSPTANSNNTQIATTDFVKKSSNARSLIMAIALG